MMSESKSSRGTPATDDQPAKPTLRRLAWWEWVDLLELFSYVLCIFLE